MARQIKNPRSVWQNPIHFIAFGFGSGTMPWAPGTFGTVAAIPLYCFIAQWPLWLYGLTLLIAFVVGVYLCDMTEKALGEHDHSGIVWDEIVGFGITMIAVPYHWYWVIAGFVLFRLFDIVKPQPIRWLNDHIPGGLGVMVDDAAAAIPAWIILQILVRYLN